MRWTLVLVALAGCSGDSPQQGFRFDLSTVDFASTDLASAPLDLTGYGIDLQKPSDMAQSSGQDMVSNGSDLKQAPPDLVAVPDICLPVQSQCTSNQECCNGLCYSSNAHPSGYSCCYAPGTGCTQDLDCCTLSFGQPTNGKCINHTCT